MTRDLRYCTTECQRIDWRDRGHRKACKKIRDERAAEAARAEAPPPPPEEVFYGPAPRSHADEVRARIAAEHEAARARREANPEPQNGIPARYGSRCPICLDRWNVNQGMTTQMCCFRAICRSCEEKIDIHGPCPLCRVPAASSQVEILARVRRHVEDGLPEAINWLANRYQSGELVPQSDKKAAKLWKRAAELGNSEAMISLGMMYEEGRGNKKMDMKKAKQLYQAAADKGFAMGQTSLAIMFQTEKNYEEAFKFHMLAAAQGAVVSEYYLGHQFLSGLGVERDVDEAERWFKRSASRGHGPAHRDSVKALAIVDSRRAQTAVATAVAQPGSFALVADALVALHKCDPSVWPPKAPRALVDAVSAAPPVFCGPLVVRLDIDEDWNAYDEAKLYGVTFEGDALSMAMLCIGDALKVKLGVDCRVVEPKPGADYDFALETDGATARRGWVAAGSMLMRADDNRRWADALRRTQAAHADLLARLRAISGRRGV